MAVADTGPVIVAPKGICAFCGSERPLAQLDIVATGYRCVSCTRAAAAVADPLEHEIAAFQGPAMQHTARWMRGISAMLLLDAIMNASRLNTLVSKLALLGRGGDLGAVRVRFVAFILLSVATAAVVGCLSFGARERPLAVFLAAMAAFIGYVLVTGIYLTPLVFFSLPHLLFPLMLALGLRAALQARARRAATRGA